MFYNYVTFNFHILKENNDHDNTDINIGDE